MEPVSVRIIDKSKELPPMSHDDFFHSPELFCIAERTPGHKPFMAVAEDAEGHVVAHMLATVRRRGILLPPFIFTQGRIYGEGEYDDDADRDTLFEMMLTAITRKFRRRLCLYAEFSDMSTKMFGYRHFRKNKYFAVNWQEIHNSLIDEAPEALISKKMERRIRHAREQGVEVREARNADEISELHHLIKRFFRIKVRRFIPSEKMFQELADSESGKVFVTTYHEKIIGGCVCVYSEGNAYLWYLASRRKLYMRQHPNTVTVWHAIQYAYRHNYAHIYFLDAGLPFRKNLFRDFILRFGGRPVTKYRWFRFFIPWANNMLSWIYRQ